MSEERDDPHPEFRCICIGDGINIRPEEYYGRCHERPSQEDQLCDHCRDWCTQQPTAQFVPILTPCAAVEVPF